MHDITTGLMWSGVSVEATGVTEEESGDFQQIVLGLEGDDSLTLRLGTPISLNKAAKFIITIEESDGFV
jgi:hypothetical protein